MAPSACFASNPLHKQHFNMLSLINMCCKLLERSTNYLHDMLTCVCPLERRLIAMWMRRAAALRTRQDRWTCRTSSTFSSCSASATWTCSCSTRCWRTSASRRTLRVPRTRSRSACRGLLTLESDCASALVASVASLPLILGPLYMRPL